MKTIAMIMPYFGAFPAQYRAWRQTALRNDTVDFHIFTDADERSEANIIVHKTSFERFADLFRGAFPFPIVLDRPYKLCEYKPAYGHVLQKYISRYDYWGFGDMDLVYGDIRAFLTDDLLAKYKMFLGYGHMSLFRNDNDTNTWFMARVDGYQYYVDAFSTPKITFFDEYDHRGCADRWRDCRREDCCLEEQFDGGVFPFDNVSKPKQSYHFNSLTRGWRRVVFEHVGRKLYMVRARGGRVERRESLYAHFQHRPFTVDTVTDYDHFLVLPSRITDYPKHFANAALTFYCRDRRLMTLYYRLYARAEYKLRTWRERLRRQPSLSDAT